LHWNCSLAISAIACRSMNFLFFFLTILNYWFINNELTAKSSITHTWIKFI
jgi:hypothetical protein